MSNNKTKKHRTIQYVFKISTIIIICGLIVLLLPKIEGFKYSYQKGMPWKYETLIAPLDFPLHKSAEELASDIEKIKGRMGKVKAQCHVGDTLCAEGEYLFALMPGQNSKK